MASSYGYLGQRGPITGALDTTGLNTGNWTVTFTPVILNYTVPEAFVYKLNTIGARGSSFNILIDNVVHDTNIYGQQNSWFDDADDSLLLRRSVTLSLLYNDPVSDNTPPVAWLFLRYDLNKWGPDYS